MSRTVFDTHRQRMKERDPFNNLQAEIREMCLFKEEYDKESDRGAVLIAATRFDEVLKSLLRAYLCDSKSTNELIEGFNAPLASFAARASAAHALSLIEDQEFKEITLIRKIRNEFGHKWRDIGFESEKIRSYCSELPWRGPDVTEEEKKPSRARFTFAVVKLLTDLLWRQRLVVMEKRTPRSWAI